ncbi:MAG TPA: hypothetical protein PK413_16470, partial [Thermoanaerobaculia bacterium]|nr:hypothetical protein [Thermoanaerobaculia bacterium]
MAAASSLPRRALLSLAGLATLSALFSTGCPPSPAPARCSAVLQNTLTGDRQAVALGDNAFPRAFWVCGENPSRSQVEAAWSGYLEARLAELCAPGGPPFLERAIFCQGGSWCRVPTTTVCEVNQPNSDTARCTPPPTMAGLAECSGPPPGTPRLCVEPAAGVSFGHVPVNTLGTQTLRLTNCGGAGRVVVAPPTARDITPMMDPPGDSFVGTGLEPSWDCALTPAEMDPMVGGAILGPGARSQCEITLRFRPGTQGAKTASLALSYHLGDRNNQLQRVPLEGIGDVGKLLFAGNAL